MRAEVPADDIVKWSIAELKPPAKDNKQQVLAKRIS